MAHVELREDDPMFEPLILAANLDLEKVRQIVASDPGPKVQIWVMRTTTTDGYRLTVIKRQEK